MGIFYYLHWKFLRFCFKYASDYQGLGSNVLNISDYSKLRVYVDFRACILGQRVHTKPTPKIQSNTLAGRDQKSQEKLVTQFMDAPLLAFFFAALAIYYTQTFFCNLLLLLYNLDSLVSLGRKVEKVGLFWHKLLPFVHNVPSIKNLFRNWLIVKWKKKPNWNLYMTIFLSFQKRNLQHKVIVENYSRFNIEIRISVFAEICNLGRYLKEIIHNSSLLNNV